MNTYKLNDNYIFDNNRMEKIGYLSDRIRNLDDKAARHVFANLVKNYANKWVGSPIQNPKGKQWVKDMLRLKKYGLDKGIPKVVKAITKGIKKNRFRSGKRTIYQSFRKRRL